MRLFSRALAARPVAALLLAWVCLGIFGAAAGADPMDPVRVQIVAGQKTVVVTDAVGKSVRVKADREGLLVDARLVGSTWHSADNGPFRVRALPGGEEFAVRGRLLVRRAHVGLSVINEVPLENYVVGTLGAEMYASWEPAALQAQAVACRTYALYHQARRTGEPFDLGADVSSQRYLGLRGESDSARAAARATAGEIISYDGRPALAAFHSASGGRTASAREVWGTAVPYLRSLPVADEDDSPDTYWRAVISGAELGRALAHLGHSIGVVEAAEVASRSASGRVSRLSFRGGLGRATVTGRELRQVIGNSTIRSTLFDVRAAGGGVAFVGSGSGHGVGMSQWGAQAMAEEGAGYREILGNFYPGTTLDSVVEQGRRFAKLRAETRPGEPGQGDMPSKMTGDQAR